MDRSFNDMSLMVFSIAEVTMISDDYSCAQYNTSTSASVQLTTAKKISPIPKSSSSLSTTIITESSEMKTDSPMQAPSPLDQNYMALVPLNAAKAVLVRPTEDAIDKASSLDLELIIETGSIA